MTNLYVISGPPHSGKRATIEEMKKISRTDKIYFIEDACKYTYQKFDKYKQSILRENNEEIRGMIYSNQLLLEDIIPSNFKAAIINKGFGDHLTYDAINDFKTIYNKDFSIFHKQNRQNSNRDYKKIFLFYPSIPHSAADLFCDEIIKHYKILGYDKEVMPIFEPSIEKRAIMLFEEIFKNLLVKI